MAKLKKITQVELPIDFISPLIKFPLSIPVAIIKAIVLTVLMIVGQIMHICVPPGPLTIESCPEAAASLINIYQLFQWEDKNSNFISLCLEIIGKQLEGFNPFYLLVKRRLFRLFFERYSVTRKSQVLYYVCGAADFTTVCS